MVLWGTSATAAVLINYLPGHMVFRTPDMQRIYDGFLPMSTGATIRQVDVPLIEVPTMTEVVGSNRHARARMATRRATSSGFMNLPAWPMWTAATAFVSSRIRAVPVSQFPGTGLHVGGTA